MQEVGSGSGTEVGWRSVNFYSHLSCTCFPTCKEREKEKFHTGGENEVVTGRKGTYSYFSDYIVLIKVLVNWISKHMKRPPRFGRNIILSRHNHESFIVTRKHVPCVWEVIRFAHLSQDHSFSCLFL